MAPRRDPPKRPRLSIVIPTFRDGPDLAALLGQIAGQEGGEYEVVVANSGSTDETRRIARQAGAVSVECGRGRARALNAGRRAARADRLLFLHADSRFTSPRQLGEACEVFARALDRDPAGRVAGFFGIEFLWSGAPPAGAGFYEAKSALLHDGTRNGDQGVLITATYLEELGGFDERLPFLEDRLLAAGIERTGRWVRLPGRLSTSGRRLEQVGLARQQARSAIILGVHDAGCLRLFEDPAGLYPVHGADDRPLMAPFLRHVLAVTGRDPWYVRLRYWFGVGRYVRENCWQVSFLVDYLRSGRDAVERHPVLRFHDRTLAPLMAWALFDGLAMVITYIWFRSILLISARAERDVPARSPEGQS